MITFKINGTRFKIPTDWQDVTYAQYVALIEPGSLPDHIALFTGIKKEILLSAELRNVESISLALAFLTTPPKFHDKPTMLVGPYTLPEDITINSLGQFEDLRGLLNKIPKDLATKEGQFKIADLYLEACAIYCQKIIYGEYDYTKVSEVKEELKRYSCMEVISTGAFFLFKPLNISKHTKTRSQSIRQRLKKLIVDFPGYQKTLDSLQRSLGKAKG